jgi:hypothetical protein
MHTPTSCHAFANMVDAVRFVVDIQGGMSARDVAVRHVVLQT